MVGFKRVLSDQRSHVNDEMRHGEAEEETEFAQIGTSPRHLPVLTHGRSGGRTGRPTRLPTADIASAA